MAELTRPVSKKAWDKREEKTCKGNQRLLTKGKKGDGDPSLNRKNPRRRKRMGKGKRKVPKVYAFSLPKEK